MFADAARTPRYTLNPENDSLETLDDAQGLTNKLVDPTKVPEYGVSCPQSSRSMAF